MKIKENSVAVPTRTFQAPATRGELSERAAEYVRQLQVAEAHRRTIVECDSCFADSPKGSGKCIVCGESLVSAMWADWEAAEENMRDQMRRDRR